MIVFCSVIILGLKSFLFEFNPSALHIFSYEHQFSLLGCYSDIRDIKDCNYKYYKTWENGYMVTIFLKEEDNNGNLSLQIIHWEIIEIEAPNYDEARILLYITLKQKGIVEVIEWNINKKSGGINNNEICN